MGVAHVHTTFYQLQETIYEILAFDKPQSLKCYPLSHRFPSPQCVPVGPQREAEPVLPGQLCQHVPYALRGHLQRGRPAGLCLDRADLADVLGATGVLKDQEGGQSIVLLLLLLFGWCFTILSQAYTYWKIIARSIGSVHSRVESVHT